MIIYIGENKTRFFSIMEDKKHFALFDGDSYFGIASNSRIALLPTPCKFTLVKMKDGNLSLLFLDKYFIVSVNGKYKKSEIETKNYLKIKIECFDFMPVISRGTSAIVYDTFLKELDKSDNKLDFQRVCRICFNRNDRRVPKEKELLEKYCLFPERSEYYHTYIIDEYRKCYKIRDTFDDYTEFFKYFYHLFDAMVEFERIKFHHGDISCSNIMYDPVDKCLKIIDLDFSFFVDNKPSKEMCNNNYNYNELVMNLPCEMNMIISNDYSGFKSFEDYADKGYMDYFKSFYSYSPYISNICIENVKPVFFQLDLWKTYFKNKEDVYYYVNCYQLCLSFCGFCRTLKVPARIVTYFFSLVCDYKNNKILTCKEIKDLYKDLFLNGLDPEALNASEILESLSNSGNSGNSGSSNQIERMDTVDTAVTTNTVETVVTESEEIIDTITVIPTISSNTTNKTNTVNTPLDFFTPTVYSICINKKQGNDFNLENDKEIKEDDDNDICKLAISLFPDNLKK